MEWQQLKLKDIGKVFTGKTPPGDSPEAWGDGVPFLTPSDFDGGRYVEQFERRLSSHGKIMMQRIIIPYGVSVSCIGWQMGKSVLVKEPTLTNQQINSIVYNKSIVEGKFLYYCMKNRRDEIFRLGSGGSRTPILKKSLFEDLPISLPPLEEQRGIARILGTLDDKIELNRKLNHNLEAMAQAIFRSWFVDFEPVTAKRDGRKPVGMDDATAALFPEHFQDSEMGQIPAGWRVEKIENCITRHSVGAKYDQKTVFDSGKVPVLDQGKSGVIGYHNDTPGVIASVDKPIIVFANHTCYMRLITFPFSAIQNVLPFTGKELDTIWTYYATYGIQEFVEYKGHWPDFVINKIVVPPKSITEAFGRVVKVYTSKMHQNQNQIDSLVKLRDALLPQLLSGELSIDTTAIMTGEV